MTHNPKRGDKALNPELCSNGRVSAVFGAKVYIKGETLDKSAYYPRYKLIWWDEGKAGVPAKKKGESYADTFHQA